jgi:hypothetical protein
MPGEEGGGRRSGRRTLPESVRREIWVRSGGRCAVCNKYLMEGGVTAREVSFGELAHIVGQQRKAGSPRGLDEMPEADRDQPDNLMLICGDEHDEVDDPSVVDVMSVEKLREIKERHEDRIRHVTGLAEDRRTTVLRMLAPIRGNAVELARETAATTVIRSASRFPDFSLSQGRHGIEIDLRHLPGEAEAAPRYYETATARVDEVIEHKLRDGLDHDLIAHLSVFGFARLPLLVYLGSKLDDTIPTDIYQRHRSTEQWEWPEGGTSVDFRREVVRADDGRTEAILVLNVSGVIQMDELPGEVDGLPAVQIAPMGVPAEPDIIQSKETLAAFEATIRSYLAFTEEEAKSTRVVHVFAAVPVSAAVVLGRVRDPQVHPTFRLYDRAAAGYQAVLDIA